MFKPTPTTDQPLSAETPVALRAVTREVFAQRWDVSPRYVSELISDKILPSVKMGRRCLRIPIPEGDDTLIRLFSSSVEVSK